jgi:hypothetical protein
MRNIFAGRKMKRVCGWLSVVAIVSLFVGEAKAEAITGAQYEAALDRYGHFAAGRPHEYSRLSTMTDAGRSLALELPEDQVFEDVAPRLVRLGAAEPIEVLAIVSQRGSGARLVLFRLRNGRMEVSAESPPVGISHRWMNPVGVADLDGDGQAEVVAVTTPHIGGTLKIYRRSGSKLVETAALTGFSNHAYGSPELGLSMPVLLKGRWHLLVPDTSRTRLRLVAMEQGRLVEVGRCNVPGQVTGPIMAIEPTVVSVGLASGPHMVHLDPCVARGGIDGKEKSKTG